MNTNKEDGSLGASWSKGSYSFMEFGKSCSWISSNEKDILNAVNRENSKNQCRRRCEEEEER